VLRALRLAGAVHLPAGCLFGAYPRAASARSEKQGQQARSSLPEVSAEACVRVVPRSEEPAAEQPLVEQLWAVPASDAAVALQQAAEVVASDAVAVPQQVAEVAVLDAAAEPQRVAEEAVLDAAAGPQQVAAVPGVAAELRPGAALDVAVLLPAAQGVQAAATAGVSSAFRRGRRLPWPAPRRAGRFAHAMRRPQIASPSERSWQAARCEGLS
jgi:hypothetical protein